MCMWRLLMKTSGVVGVPASLDWLPDDGAIRRYAHALRLSVQSPEKWSGLGRAGFPGG